MVDSEREGLVDRLGSHLAARIEDRGAAGFAVASSDPPREEAVWVPSSLVQEPGFLAYSITKTFTSALILLLQEERRLSLSDSLARWFPRVSRSREITILHLLNHTAGIPDYGSLSEYHDAVRNSPATPWTFEQFEAHTYGKGLLFAPGSGWAYSNPGYMLLKRIAEEVACLTYSELIDTRIVRPLGLHRTFVPESINDLGTLAPGCSRSICSDEKPTDVRTSYHPGWVSHGVVASTPSEVAAFYHALFGGRLLSSRCVRELTSPVPVPKGPPRWRKPSYGLGIMGDPESPFGPIWGHNGGGPGYNTSAFHVPEFGERPVTVCAMCAVEQDLLAENLVFEAFDLMREPADQQDFAADRVFPLSNLGTGRPGARRVGLPKTDRGCES